MIRSIAVAHPRTTTFQKKNLSARSDQIPCSNTAAAEALLHLQSSRIQLNEPSRQQAGFQTKLYSSVGLNQHGSLEGNADDVLNAIQHQNKEAAPLHPNLA
jgi:hypothetical protein